MQNHKGKLKLLSFTLLFIITPLIVYTLADTPHRTVLKEGISLLTMMAIFQMVAQFYSTRSNRRLLRTHGMGLVGKIHKIMGYLFIGILLLHPFMIAIPRFFEAGITPQEALVTILATTTLGVVTGMIAWCLMLLLFITSLLRKKLSLTYSTWRVIHGLLAVWLIFFGAWHALELGRHSTHLFALTLVAGALGGFLLLVQSYFPGNQVKKGAVI